MFLEEKHCGWRAVRCLILRVAVVSMMLQLDELWLRCRITIVTPTCFRLFLTLLSFPPAFPPPLTERGPVPAYQSTKLARAAIFETEKQTHWNKTLLPVNMVLRGHVASVTMRYSFPCSNIIMYNLLCRCRPRIFRQRQRTDKQTNKRCAGDSLLEGTVDLF